MPQPASTDPTFGPTWPNFAVSAAMVRSQSVANTLPPPMAKPFTRAITGFGTSRMIDWNSSIGRPTMPRPSYCPSCALWSPPVQNALSPAPVSTIEEMRLVVARDLKGLDQLLHRLRAEGVVELRPVDDDPGRAVVALLVENVFEHGGVGHRDVLQDQIMFMPPATEMVWPVMKDASSEARKATMPA